jgi:Raf kinase inhibitor-like YbhB/YbcL family protein
MPSGEADPDPTPRSPGPAGVAAAMGARPSRFPADPAPPPTLQLDSPAFAAGQPIPRIYTLEGSNLSPPLRWSGAPAATLSFSLILDDPDASAGPWIHWVLYDIPAGSTGLPAGLPHAPQLADGSRQGRCWGVHHFGRHGYQGPQPPAGPAHRYRFTLTALADRLGLPEGASAPDLLAAMADLRLAEAVLWGTYASGASRR